MLVDPQQLLLQADLELGGKQLLVYAGGSAVVFLTLVGA